MNRLVIIGNGFDIAHGLKTRYKDFIYWYMYSTMSKLFVSHKIDESEKLLNLKTSQLFDQSSLYGYNDKVKEAYNNDYRVYHNNPLLLVKDLEQYGFFTSFPSDFLKLILHNIESKGWTDIESDYYTLLKDNKSESETCKKLNEQLDCLRKSLCDYLRDKQAMKHIDYIVEAINQKVTLDEIAESSKMPVTDDIPDKIKQNGKEKASDKLGAPREVMLLNFNYTDTANMYEGRYNDDTEIKVNFIHGSLNDEDKIIFGYGDEMDTDFLDLVDINDNELLKNSKSIKYLETNNYKKLLQFIEGGYYQVLIMGHSCGNSDRTLLNTIFEHKNCISIKPYCYINNNEEDNYSELTRNIYRNFKDKTLFRERVVDKTLCYTLDGRKLT